MVDQSTIAIVIVGAVAILYATEIIPLAVTSILACIAMAVSGIMTFPEAFSGFGHDIVMLVAGVMVIGASLFHTGVADYLGKGVIRTFGENEKRLILGIIITAACLSAFLSNTATVAMFIPIINTVVSKSNGKITKKNTFMALGISSVAGGACTLVGSTPQLVVQGLLIEGGYRPIGFFELGLAAIPRVVLITIYFMSFGYAIQKRVFDFEDSVKTIDHKKNNNITHESRIKMLISILILLGCIIGFIAQVWSVGTLALLGACLCIITKCIGEKEAYLSIDWTTIIVLGGALGFASGLQSSGAGDKIANFTISMLGDNPSKMVVLSVLILLATIMGNLMSQTATAAILGAIGITVAQKLNMDPTTVAICIVLGANLSYATPVATPPMTMTLVGGYRFMDYVKVGGVLTILGYILTLVIVPIVYTI